MGTKWNAKIAISNQKWNFSVILRFFQKFTEIKTIVLDKIRYKFQ